MQDLKTRRPEEAVVDSDATSKETLEDLKKKVKISDSESASAGESQAPSPDGALDEANEIKDAGPM
jgi:hypothetical protein